MLNTRQKGARSKSGHLYFGDARRDLSFSLSFEYRFANRLQSNTHEVILMHACVYVLRNNNVCFFFFFFFFFVRRRAFRALMLTFFL